MNNERPSSLRVIQAIAVCIVQRNTNGALQGLRMLLELADEPDAIRMIRLMTAQMSPADRYWFGTMNGMRNSMLEHRSQSAEA